MFLRILIVWKKDKSLVRVWKKYRFLVCAVDKECLFITKEVTYVTAPEPLLPPPLS